MEIKIFRAKLKEDSYTWENDITEKEWKAILQNKIVMKNRFKSVLLNFYKQPGHKGTCQVLGAHCAKSAAKVAKDVVDFGQAVQKTLNRFRIFGTDNEPTYWVIPMTGEYNGKVYEWVLRPDLIRAIEDIYQQDITSKDEFFINRKRKPQIPNHAPQKELALSNKNILEGAYKDHNSRNKGPAKRVYKKIS